MANGPSDLYDVCSQLLAAANEALGLDGAGGTIDRAYVSPGPPAWDCCPQLTVHAGGPSQGDTAPLQPPLQPGHRAGDGRVVSLVSVTLTVLRCIPVIEGEGQSLLLPSADDLEDAARDTMGDAWAIWNHVEFLKKTGALFPPKEREMFFDPAVVLASAGGCAGYQMQFRIQLNGFRY